ncbi:protein SFI1 homolog [Lineus longissimus]|uniref:protein SFI1 homolog n=1 Tax=Lineus longissimus TaxID=88925 RepID=UPI00315CF48B
MMFTHLKKKQDGMQQIAAECYASAIICRSFSLWKDKAGRRLRWEQMLMYEDTPAACRVADAFQETVQNKHVRQCFLLWRERLRRVTIVRVYHQKDVMQRCLLGWHHWSASHSSQRLRWRQFRINSLLKQKFSTWRLRFSLMQETERRFQRCQKLKIQDMFERWHLWTAETKSRREIGLQLQKKFSLRKKARAFWSWKHTFLHHKKMDVFYHSHLVKRHLNGWRNYTDKRKDLQKKLDILAQRKLKRVTRFVFIQWRENHASAVELRLEEDRRLKQLTVKYYLKWRRCVMETRMVILYETNLMRRVFQAWSLQTRKGIQLAGVLRDALTMWRRRVTINRALHQASEEWLELHRYDRLEKTFACWMCKFRARVTAERHYEAVLQKRIFCHWVQHLKKQKELHKRAGNLVYRQQYRLIRCAFKRWTNCYDVICEQYQVLECHLEAKDVNTKRTILCSWHEMSLWRRAVRHCNMGLKKKQFTAWWSRTEGCLANKKKATEFRTEHDQVLLRNKFTVWQAETEQAQTAIVHYHKALEERVIKQWCSVIVKKKQLQILAAELQTTKSEKLVKISWEAWTGDWRRRIDLRERLDRLQDRLALRKQGTSFRIWRLKCIEVLRTKNYQKRVLQKYFRVWHCLTRQKREFNERVDLLEKKRQEYLQSVYGTIWKNRVQVTKFAVELAKHRFMETSWQRWRQALIREKGSQRFLELDNKLIVKETFDAWKQFVLHKKNDKAFKNHTDSGMVLDDPDTLSEVDTTQSSHRSSGFFSESDSELHAVHSSPSCLVLPGKLKFSS